MSKTASQAFLHGSVSRGTEGGSNTLDGIFKTHEAETKKFKVERQQIKEGIKNQLSQND
jgi:hypothetical protein